MDKIRRGCAAFRRLNLALLAAGFATFALMYAVQPLLPAFSARFGVSAAGASLALSSTTAALALALPLVSALSETLGRAPVMRAAMLAAGLLAGLQALAPSWHLLLALRTLQGLAFAGVPAVAMAFVAEEVAPDAAGHAMGLYIAGSAFGGMTGRILAGVLANWLGFRIALLGLAGLSLAAAIGFVRLLPPSRHFVPRVWRPANIVAGFTAPLRDPALLGLDLIGFCLLGALVASYNFIGFRLVGPPFHRNLAMVGLISALYLGGMAASALAGRLGDRLGRARLMVAAILLMLVGTALTLPDRLGPVLGGMALLTAGFFAAHALASTEVARRAKLAPAQASALYLFAYYMGSSLAGSAGGLAYRRWGWDGVATMVTALLATALIPALALGQDTA